MKTKYSLTFAAWGGALLLCLANVAHAAEGPYGGTPAAIPGKVMAENYDTGGQGVAYNVTSVNGTDNSYRSDGVDLETATSPATGNDLGWTASGQWFRYTVNVATAGTYTVSLLVAAPTAVTDGFHISNSSGTDLSGTINVPKTGGWEDWTTVTATVTLPAGTQTLTVNQDNAGWNIDYLYFAAAEGPYGGTPAAIPGKVMAENYDTGGQGIGYNVTSVNGTDNSYRSDGVDLETATSPATGNDLGWTASGQWFRYTVNVAAAGTYTVTFLVAAPSAVTDGFHISNSSGTDLSGTINVPKTGGWEDWTTVTATVTLPAGTQTLTVNQDNAGWNIDYLSFASETSSCVTVPSAPTGLAASGTSSSETTLSWTADTPPANCSITSYTVLEGGGVIGTATGTSFTVTGLSASTTYSFTVEANDSEGASPASSALKVTTSAASCNSVPSAPTGLAASGTGSSGTTLSWTADTAPANCSISSYTVLEGGTEIGTATGTSFAVTGLSASTTYSFTVEANDSEGASPASSALKVTTAAASSNVFAPFEYVGDLNDADQLPTILTGSGVKAVILAFLTPNNNGCNLGWPGVSGNLPNDTLGSTSIGSVISEYQAKGVTIAISQGGAGGQEAAAYCSTAADTQAVYQQIITQYNVKWLDFDIEYTETSGQSTRRATALAALQKANPGLIISFTLPVDTPADGTPDGLDTGSNGGTTDVTDAISAGVNLNIINGMAMDFGNETTDQATLAEESAAAVESWIKSEGFSSKVGITVLPGTSDDSGAVFFTLADATTIVDYAEANSYITLLSFWELNRDNGGCPGSSSDQDTCSGLTQSTWELSGIFGAY